MRSPGPVRPTGRERTFLVRYTKAPWLVIDALFFARAEHVVRLYHGQTSV